MPAFTVLQRTNFLMNAPQMALSNAQRAALANEGFVNELDFLDFDHATLKQSFKNTRSINPAVPIPAKSVTRLLIASTAFDYYTDTGRAITPQNMHYNTVLRGFIVSLTAETETSTVVP